MRRYIGGQNCLLTGHYEVLAIGEPFCDKIIFRRDGIMTLDGEDVKWSGWQEVGGEIPSEAKLIETEAENGNNLTF